MINRTRDDVLEVVERVHVLEVPCVPLRRALRGPVLPCPPRLLLRGSSLLDDLVHAVRRDGANQVQGGRRDARLLHLALVLGVHVLVLVAFFIAADVRRDGEQIVDDDRVGLLASARFTPFVLDQIEQHRLNGTTLVL
eukprot:CAMPEP_0113275522 /NCGR_PEP_ID=MMETSP0008_2-20120614/24990_1 /TAXON_ID=97485 /ORGANISM="Prymnesium parvum" /LENGTH=137 /DNA_ID=CAMNT_0000125233 /DNA_START=397 /DNA_END=810 /DNA_ORIENTATION=+ /assembly_acc=CAM_ASM_000153